MLFSLHVVPWIGLQEHSTLQIESFLRGSNLQGGQAGVSILSSQAQARGVQSGTLNASGTLHAWQKTGVAPQAISQIRQELTDLLHAKADDSNPPTATKESRCIHTVNIRAHARAVIAK